MTTTPQTPEPLRKLAIWFVFLLIALMAFHLLSCQPYPAQSKVLKQNTKRYNEKVGR